MSLHHLCVCVDVWAYVCVTVSVCLCIIVVAFGVFYLITGYYAYQPATPVLVC